VAERERVRTAHGDVTCKAVLGLFPTCLHSFARFLDGVGEGWGGGHCLTHLLQKRVAFGPSRLWSQFVRPAASRTCGGEADIESRSGNHGNTPRHAYCLKKTVTRPRTPSMETSTATTAASEYAAAPYSALRACMCLRWSTVASASAVSPMPII